MKLTMLGTGHALVTKCYNTCFTLEDEGRIFLVDGGGGNTILRQLKLAGIDLKDIKDIFITHRHVDHITGIIWLVRVIGQQMTSGAIPESDVRIYGHGEVLGMIDTISRMLLSKKSTGQIGKRIHLVEVQDGESREICGHKTTFFDVQSTKAKQYGFAMEIGENRILACCGDEPYYPHERKYCEHADWLLHEAFCLDSQADLFKPYGHQHCTVKDACEAAEELQVKNLLLYHTEDENIRDRTELYTKEGKQYYHGNLWVPEDLEVIEL